MKHWLIKLGLSFAVATAAPHALADDECQFQGTTPVNSAVINKCAEFFKTMLVGKGKLEASWKGVVIDSTELVHGPKGQEWDVIYKNPVDPDATKRTLHMIFALSGNIVAVTFDKN